MTDWKALQRALRRLGYLRSGIDGVFGRSTALAVKALQHDLLTNDGRGPDGAAPVRVLDYNRGRIVAVTGRVDHALLACMADMLDDPQFPTLPSVADPVAENRTVAAQIAALSSPDVPIPFLLAMLRQESNLKHFHEPQRGDDDTHIVVGLDTNATQPHIITSRGYGVGQYTLFHHPPTQHEVEDCMLDVGKNLQQTIRKLREKFDHFVNGPTSGTRADDRVAEYGTGPLRLCKYRSDDPRYLRDCLACARNAGVQDIEAGVTPLYPGARYTFQPTPYYKHASYRAVPVRKNMGCDWPYAIRRYNGAGINSYHYQARVLKNLSGS
jgi:peptidoglycan hydrolase-like protein with peptidoglycan-binding domain